MVMMPHKIVKNGSHSFGEAFLSTRLLGTSLSCCQSFYLCCTPEERDRGSIPADVKQVEHGQPDVVLIISHARVSFEADNFRVSDICAIKKRAQKDQCE
jgi:hypothetical protein